MSAKYKAWVAGFAAACYLFSGRYNDYARERDAWLNAEGSGANTRASTGRGAKGVESPAGREG